MSKQRQNRARFFVRALFNLMDTEPSRKTVSAVSVLIIASIGLGVGLGQYQMQEKANMNCQALAQGQDTDVDGLNPYYDMDNMVCVDPQLYPSNNTTVDSKPGGNHQTNVTS